MRNLNWRRRELELIRVLQVVQTLSVHHGALAYLLEINAPRASEADAVRIEDYADSGQQIPRRSGGPRLPRWLPAEKSLA